MTTTYDPAVLRASLVQHEGVRSTIYTDTTGNKTLGIGHNVSIAQSQYVIDALYDCDVRGCEASLDLHLPWWRGLDPVRQAALVELMFNLGWGSLSTFCNTLAAWQAGKYGAAAQGLLNSKWAGQVHGRANDIAGMVKDGTLPGWLAAAVAKAGAAA